MPEDWEPLAQKVQMAQTDNSISSQEAQQFINESYKIAKEKYGREKNAVLLNTSDELWGLAEKVLATYREKNHGHEQFTIGNLFKRARGRNGHDAIKFFDGESNLASAHPTARQEEPRPQTARQREARPPVTETRVDMSRGQQSQVLQNYIAGQIRNCLGAQYGGMNCQEFVELALGDLNKLPNMSAYFDLLKQPNTLSMNIASLRNGEILTAVLCGEVNLTGKNREEQYLLLSGLRDRILKKGEVSFSTMTKMEIPGSEDLRGGKAKILSALEKTLQVEEYAILSYSSQKFGHTGIVERTPAGYVFYNSGIMEGAGAQGVGGESLDEHLTSLLERTRGQKEWVRNPGAYFWYVHPKREKLVFPDGKIVTPEKRGSKYFFNGEQLILDSSRSINDISFTIGKIPSDGNIIQRIGDTGKAETTNVQTALKRAPINAQEQPQWSQEILSAMHASGIPVTHENTAYIAGILMNESGVNHNPLKWGREGAGKAILARFDSYGMKALEIAIKAVLTRDETQYIETGKASLGRCKTELDFYRWSQEQLSALNRTQSLFSNESSFRTFAEKGLSLGASILKAWGIDTDIAPGEGVRPFLLRTLSKKPETFGAMQLNADMLLARMNADLASVQKHPEFKKLIISGRISRDLLVRNLLQDPSLSPANKISRAASLELGFSYYVRPIIFAYAPRDGKLKPANIKYATADHLFGMFASRNSDIQQNLNRILGIEPPLIVDGDLVNYEKDGRISSKTSSTETAVQRFITQHIPEWRGKALVKAKEVCMALGERMDLQKAYAAGSVPPASVFLDALDKARSSQGTARSRYHEGTLLAAMPGIRSLSGQTAEQYARAFITPDNLIA